MEPISRSWTCTRMRRFLQLRRLFRLLPLLLRYLDKLDALWPKLEALNQILERLSSIDSRITELDVLHAAASVSRLEALDVAIKRIEKVANAKPEPSIPVKSNGHSQEVHRLQTLSKFAQLSGKAQEIEKEWQRIQQDEFDAVFAHQITGGKNGEDLAFKQGVSKGIKWCVEHFS